MSTSNSHGPSLNLVFPKPAIAHMLTRAFSPLPLHHICLLEKMKSWISLLKTPVHLSIQRSPIPTAVSHYVEIPPTVAHTRLIPPRGHLPGEAAYVLYCFAHRHLNFGLIALLLKNLNAIHCTQWISTEHKIPVGYGHGCQCMPMVLKWVGIEGFCGYGFG